MASIKIIALNNQMTENVIGQIKWLMQNKKKLNKKVK
jgi:hypothetical protein